MRHRDATATVVLMSRLMLTRIHLCAAAVFVLECATAQTNLSIYSDSLAAGFQNWSWNAGHNNFANSSPTHSGSESIAFTGGYWEAISIWHADFNPAPYTNLSFWINGGASGGQAVQVYFEYTTTTARPINCPPSLAAMLGDNSLCPSALSAVITNFHRLDFQLTANGTTNAFYLDDLSLVAIPPSPVHLKIDAAQTLRPADSRWFGLNTAVWDGNFDTPATSTALAELGTRILRFPGGSLSDGYHWATGRSLNNNWSWGTSFANFIHIATNVGAQAMITVNYGTGTSNEAAAWVKCGQSHEPPRLQVLGSRERMLRHLGNRFQ